MTLDHHDTLELLDLLLKREPQSPRPDGFRVRLQRLRDLIGKTDTAEHSLATLAKEVFSGVSASSLRETLRQFRSSLADASAAVGVRFDLIRTNSRKGALPDEILLHFEGTPLPSAKGSVTRESILHLNQTQLEAPRSVPDVIRIFVSFSTTDEREMTELVEMLRKTWGTRRAHQIDFWVFHDPRKGGLLSGESNAPRVRQEIATCPFGLILLSPDYMHSPFILDHELSAYFPDVPDKHPILVNFRNSGPASPHLPHEAPGKFIFSLEKQSFAEMRGKTRKEQFAMALNDHIEALCRKHFSFSLLEKAPDIPPHPHRERLDCLVPPPDAEHLETVFAKYETDGETGIDTVQDLLTWSTELRRAHYFALLGEVGSGKTTAALMFARDLNALQGQVQAHYFDMRYVNYDGLLDRTNKRPKLNQVIGAILSRHGDSKAKAEDYLRAVRENRAVLIFDGLDEIFVSLNESEQDALMHELLGALPLSVVGNRGAGKLLLACRTHYFRSHIAERGAFTLQGREGIDMEQPGGNKPASIERARMLPFSRKQIEAYFQANVPSLPFEKIWNLLSEIHNLRELATRPYLLNLIRLQLPALSDKLDYNQKVRSVDLYHGFTQDWSHERNKFHNIVSAEDKLEIMGRLAAFLWRQETKTLPAGELENWLLDTLIAKPRWAVIYADHLKAGRSEGILSDFRAASFVSRWDGELFRFAHTSLQEYFLARHLIRALEEGNSEEWSLPLLNRESLDFATELFVQRGEESTVAKRKMEDTFAKLLGESVSGRSENSLAFLLCLHATGESDWIAPTVDLRNLDLTAWEIGGTARKPLILPHANFAGATLIRARFHHVEMDGSIWQDADLCSAEFLSCALDLADFSGARLEGGRLRNSRLTGSHCAGADAAGLRIQLPVWDAETEAAWSSPSTWLPLAQPFESKPEAIWNLGHAESVSSVTISADGKRIISASCDKSLRVWDIASGTCLHVLLGHRDNILDSVISTNGMRTVSCSDDECVRLWDTESGDCLLTLSGMGSLVLSVSIFDTEDRVVLGCFDYTIKVLDIKSGTYQNVLSGHKDVVNDVMISTDNMRIVSISYDNNVCVWDVETGACLSSFTGRTGSAVKAVISTSGQKIGCISDLNSIYILNVESSTCEDYFLGHDDSITCLAISANGELLVSGSKDKSVRILDTQSKRAKCVLSGHSKPVASVAISSDKRRIVSGSDDKSLRVWDVDSGKCLRVIPGWDNLVTSVVISSDRNFIISHFDDGTRVIWDALSGVPAERPKNDQGFNDIVPRDQDPICKVSQFGTILFKRADGLELDIAALPDGGYVVLEKSTTDAQWKIARAKGEYWRYVNYATEGPEGRVLWSADVLGPVPEV